MYKKYVKRCPPTGKELNTSKKHIIHIIEFMELNKYVYVEDYIYILYYQIPKGSNRNRKTETTKKKRYCK